MNEPRHPNSTTEIAERLGRAAKENRAALGLTLAQVCERARAAGHELDLSDLSKLERGELNWSTRRMAAVSAGIGIRFPMWCLGVVSVSEVSSA